MKAFLAFLLLLTFQSLQAQSTVVFEGSTASHGSEPIKIDLVSNGNELESIVVPPNGDYTIEVAVGQNISCFFTAPNCATQTLVLNTENIRMNSQGDYHVNQVPFVLELSPALEHGETTKHYLYFHRTTGKLTYYKNEQTISEMLNILKG